MNDFTNGAPGDRLPNLIRTREGYRAYDPSLVAGTQYAIDDRGDLVYTRLPAGAATATVVLGSVVAALWIGDDSWLWTGVAFLLALPTGFVLVLGLLALVHLATNPARRYRHRTGRAAFAVEVSEIASADGQLCRRAESLAASRAWTAGRVDPARRLEWLLWHAVGEGDPAAVAELTSLTEPSRPGTEHGADAGTDPDLQIA